METATVTFEDGLQTIHLPKGFHLPTSTVSIRHEGEAIVLEPLKAKSWPEKFFDLIHVSDTTFVRPEQGTLPPIKNL